MSKKPDPYGPYRVSIHVDKGYRYARTREPYIDPDTGKKKYRHTHWGRLDEKNRFIPGPHFINATSEERCNLIFPKDWNLSELKKYPGSRRMGRPHKYPYDQLLSKASSEEESQE